MFEGEKVRLVVLEENHIDNIMEGWNDPTLRGFLGGTIPVTRRQEVEWIEGQHQQMKNRTGFVFVIEKNADDSFIGTVGINSIDWISRSAGVGIAIYRSENWGKGYGTEAMKLLIDFCWTHLNLRRLQLTVHAFNERAQKSYVKLGFKKFGTAHSKFYVDGQYHDTDYMELFRNPEDVSE
ncbi:MAG: GNAT family N-acetyltransferase [Candidatus Thorarchaeota archaeon]